MRISRFFTVIIRKIRMVFFWFRVVILVFIFSSPARGSGLLDSPMEEAQKHLSKGKQYSIEGEYIKAEEEFKKAEDLLERFSSLDYLQPGSSTIDDADLDVDELIERANQASSEGNNALAIKLYLRASSLFPDNDTIHYNLAVEYLKSADYWDAAQEFSLAIKLNPQDAYSYYNLGILYDSFLNDKQLALIYYNKYLELNPEADDSELVKGWINSLEVGKK